MGIELVNYRPVLGISTSKSPVVSLEQIFREAASVIFEQMNL